MAKIPKYTVDVNIKIMVKHLEREKIALRLISLICRIAKIELECSAEVKEIKAI